MKKVILYLLMTISFYSCNTRPTCDYCESELRKAEEEINKLKKEISSIQEEKILITDDSIPKNYVETDKKNKRVYKPGLIKLDKSQIVYKGEDNIAWLQLSVKNNLNRAIKNVMIRIHSNDCKNVEDDYIEENLSIAPNSIKTVEIQISAQILIDKINNCYKHPPDIEIADAILENGEKYPNTTGQNFYHYR